MGPLPVMNRTYSKARPNNQNKIKGLPPTLMLVVGLLDVIVIFGKGESFDKERRPAVNAIGLCKYLVRLEELVDLQLLEGFLKVRGRSGRKG